MDRKNVIILGFAIVAIGLFIIPSTMSMFTGQHRWYSVRTADDQYKMCSRCHLAEVNEWKHNTNAHAAYKAWYIQNMTVDPGCFCHQVNTTALDEFGFDESKLTGYAVEAFNGSGEINSTDPTTWKWRNASSPHAAVTIECVTCHYNATQQINQSTAAHKKFWETARDADGGNNNTACLACHTMIGLNITIERIKSGINVWANHTNYTYWDVIVTINQTERSNESNYYIANKSYPSE